MHPTSSVNLVHLRRQDLQASAAAHRASRSPRSLAVPPASASASAADRPSPGFAARWRARLRLAGPGTVTAPPPLATGPSGC